MTTVATLDTQLLVLPPGGEASCELQIQNRADIVEGYRIEVLGETARWATVEPPTLTVYPGTQAGARIVFRIPRGYDVPAADVPFGVRVLPVEHPEHAVVPEATLRIGAYAETTAELVPRTSRTRRVATHDVAVDNRGNVPVRVMSCNFKNVCASSGESTGHSSIGRITELSGKKYPSARGIPARTAHCARLR